MKRTIKKGIYEHYKGKRYEVIGLAHHSETQEAFAVYKALYMTKFGRNSLWVRPLSMFCEQIVVNGKRIPRFNYINRRVKR